MDEDIVWLRDYLKSCLNEMVEKAESSLESIKSELSIIKSVSLYLEELKELLKVGKKCFIIALLRALANCIQEVNACGFFEREWRNFSMK